jgi:5-formyltetrahydrofolate cyclo-ligase
MGNSKQILRSELLLKRESLSVKDRIQFSKKIVSTLYESNLFQSKSILHCYSSFSSEVITSELIEKAFTLSFKIVVPIVRSSKKELIHSVITTDTTFVKGKYGIPQPSTKSEISIEQLNIQEILIVVPIVGFDKKCHRIGYGGGYYDRFLQNVPKARKIGIAFSLQETEDIPTESTDIPLDEIITEQQVFLRSQGM